eukprot:348632-Pelagomonas_calceolata.AAC.1
MEVFSRVVWLICLWLVSACQKLTHKLGHNLQAHLEPNLEGCCCCQWGFLYNLADELHNHSAQYEMQKTSMQRCADRNFSNKTKAAQQRNAISLHYSVYKYLPLLFVALWWRGFKAPLSKCVSFSLIDVGEHPLPA